MQDGIHVAAQVNKFDMIINHLTSDELEFDNDFTKMIHIWLSLTTIISSIHNFQNKFKKEDCLHMDQNIFYYFKNT